MFMTLIVWDNWTKTMKGRTKTSNLILDDFSLTFVNLSLWYISFLVLVIFRFRNLLAYINLLVYPHILEPRQVNLSNQEAFLWK